MYLFQAVLNLASTIWVNLDVPCYMFSFLLHLVGTQNPLRKHGFWVTRPFQVLQNQCPVRDLRRCFYGECPLLLASEQKVT